MAFREEYLETPLPLPPSLYGRSLARSVVRWRHNQIFSAWWVTNFSYPWCFAGALRALKLRYKQTYLLFAELNEIARVFESLLELRGIKINTEQCYETDKKKALTSFLVDR